MSPPRRRSARLASATSKPSPPVSHLPPLAEHTEPNFVNNASSTTLATAERTRLPMLSSVPSTPAQTSPIRPATGDMHPKKIHSTTEPPSSAFRLGFTDIDPSTTNKTASPLANTPSKLHVPSSAFSFRQAGPGPDQGLSDAAKRLRQELHDEAAKIKADLEAQRAKDRADEMQITGRKIAKPKGKSSRFSAAHMAEFKKMDSIENHVSTQRRLPAVPTPRALKRSPSKPNLDGADFPSIPARVSSKPKGDGTAFNSPVKASLKRSPSKANLDDRTNNGQQKQLFPGTPSKPHGTSSTHRAAGIDETHSPFKRMKQRFEDDISNSLPASRDGSFIPRPKSSHGNEGGAAALPRSQTTSTLAHLTSPTKASLARSAATTGVPATPARSSVKSPSKETLGGIPRSVTANNLAATVKSAESRRRILSPRGFDKVKSILRGNKGTTPKPMSAIPLPLTFAGQSQTPAPPRESHKPLLAAVTSPRRNRLAKRPTVEFTATNRRTLFGQRFSPTPKRSTISKAQAMKDLREVEYPHLDGIILDGMDGVSYPDLSKHQLHELTATGGSTENVGFQPAIPASFTFRSDHTIHCGPASPTGFGGSPGQSSIRHVDGFKSRIMAAMPGTYPSESIGFNKENRPPVEPVVRLDGIPHGLKNKKRHRPSWNEENAEAQLEEAERAAKKRRFEDVAEGDALVAPKFIGSTTPATPRTFKSPTKKTPSMSLSRLNMLSKPKKRV